MTMRRLAAPWAPRGSTAYCLPGSMLVKLSLGEAPASVPARNDVRDGAIAAATALDGGAIDRILRERGGSVRIARLHTAAANIGHKGARNRHYTDAEQISGVARTFLVQADHTTQLGDLADALSSISTVEWASPNYVAAGPFGQAALLAVDAVDDEEMWAPWAMIRGPQALAYEPGDSAVIVGIIDSGVAPEHREFAGRFRRGYDTVNLSTRDVAPGIEMLGTTDDPDHEPVDHYVGHGSACAAIIGALGIDMPPGMAGDAQLLPMRALGAARLPGRSAAIGMGAIADLDAAAKLAIDLGARVLNLSFGTDDAQLAPHMPKPHADVIAYGADRGCVFVAASGNNGHETTYWPAAYPQVIAVGAVGTDARPTGFSTRGQHVALCAPGDRIFTAALDGYQRATGTSFAAPFVSATAALMIARAERRAFPIDAATIKHLLAATARPFSTASPGCGAGVLDAAAAVAAVDRFIDHEHPATEDG
ncbi:S8 family serine peptidase [Sphingomonas sp. 4RDLI-65]|uniref:S8 family peptidase n=1 Tax=Sphingomonas sp. 4RDLI-65 TaxID=3111641 RepID=UPI003C29541A